MFSCRDLKKYKSNLKKLRIGKGYTQEQLSEISNVNIKSIAAYEQNPEKLFNASIKTIYKLSDALDCNLEDILNKELNNKKENKS